jgi:hypothetical protein
MCVVNRQVSQSGPSTRRRVKVIRASSELQGSKVRSSPSPTSAVMVRWPWRDTSRLPIRAILAVLGTRNRYATDIGRVMSGCCQPCRKIIIEEVGTTSVLSAVSRRYGFSHCIVSMAMIRTYIAYPGAPPKFNQFIHRCYRLLSCETCCKV